MKKQKNNSKIIIIISVLLAVILSCGFLFDFLMNYNMARGLLLQDADDRLLAAANGVKNVIGAGFHDKITGEKSISPEEHDKNVALLSEWVSKCGVDYVYSMAKYGDKIVFTSLSATKEEIEKKSYDPFFKVYNSASENVLKAFSGSEIIFEEFEDEYGNFRSIIIPVKTASGANYILGADISISALSANLASVKNRMLYNTLIVSIIFVVLCALLIYIVLTRFTYDPVVEGIPDESNAPASENTLKTIPSNDKTKPVE